MPSGGAFALTLIGGGLGPGLVASKALPLLELAVWMASALLTSIAGMLLYVKSCVPCRRSVRFAAEQQAAFLGPHGLS